MTKNAFLPGYLNIANLRALNEFITFFFVRKNLINTGRSIRNDIYYHDYKLFPGSPIS